MNNADEPAIGTNELPLLKKRRRKLWLRNRNESDLSDNVLTPKDHARYDECSEMKCPLTPRIEVQNRSYSTKLPETAEEVPKSSQNEIVSKTNASFVTKKSNDIKKFRISRIKNRESTSTTQFTVLNIPVPSQGPLSKRQKMSKIDLAILRRQSRRMRCTNEGDYESSDDSDEEEIDLSIKSGPPCKLDLTGGKAEFLDQVNLISHTSKNCIELQKLMRRKWIVPDIVQVTSDTQIQPLDLPVPSKSASGTNLMQNHKHKRNFLQFLGLTTVSTRDREEMEEVWKAVVEERLKRNCNTPLTKYYQKSYSTLDADQKTKASSLLPIVHQYKRHIFDNSEKEANSSTLHLKTEYCSKKIELPSLMPNQLYQKLFPGKQVDSQVAMKNISLLLAPAHRPTHNLPLKTLEDRIRFLKKEILRAHADKTSDTLPISSKLTQAPKLEDCKSNAVNKNASCLPLTSILVNDQNQSDKRENDKSDMENSKENLRIVREHKFKWPGLLEIREAYVRYSREKSLEIAELRKQRFALADDNLKMQNLVKFLERKQRTMHSILFKTDRENKNLQMTIDQLNNIMNSFR